MKKGDLIRGEHTVCRIRKDAHFGGHYKHSQQACNPVQMTWFCLHATIK